MANQITDTTVTDDSVLSFGTSLDYRVKFNSANNKLEVTDGTNVLMSLRDSGTTGTLETGALTLTGGAVIAGTWTPTVAAVANVASVDAVRTCFYLRFGGQVFFVFNAEATPTAGSNTVTAISFTLPVASNFTGFNQATGTCVARRANNSQVAGDLVANSTNDNIEIRFGSIDTNSHNVKAIGAYLIA